MLWELVTFRIITYLQQVVGRRVISSHLSVMWNSRGCRSAMTMIVIISVWTTTMIFLRICRSAWRLTVTGVTIHIVRVMASMVRITVFQQLLLVFTHMIRKQVHMVVQWHTVNFLRHSMHLPYIKIVWNVRIVRSSMALPSSLSSLLGVSRHVWITLCVTTISIIRMLQLQHSHITIRPIHIRIYGT